MVGVAIRILLVFVVAAFSGCAVSEPERRFEFARVCMGVRAAVTVYARDREKAERAAAAAFGRIGELDDAMSDYRAGSELMRLCARPGERAEVSEDLFRVLGESARVSEASEGAFDVTMGPAVGLWRQARRDGRLPSAEELSVARRVIGWRMVEMEETGRVVRLRCAGMKLDLGGIAKGYAAQRGVEVLKREGCPRCMVAMSGDIVVGDAPPGRGGWLIAVETEGSGPRLGVIELRNAAVSTSGDTEQAVEIGGVRYSHIIDPGTMVGMTARRCAVVVSKRGEWADALATAVCVMGVEKSRGMIAKFPRTGIVVDEATDALASSVRTEIDPSGVIRWQSGRE
jgi:thiamine biosynthesis lipoprotein